MKFDALITRLESAIDKHGSWAPGRTVLQKLLKQAPPDASCSSPSPSQPHAFIESFALAFEQETDRVRLFILSSQDQLWCRLLDIATTIASLKATTNTSPQRRRDMHAVLTKARSSLDDLGDDTIQLETFMRQNVVACAHLAQLADGHHHHSTTNDNNSKKGSSTVNPASSFPLYIACMEEKLAVGGPALGVLLLSLSDTYEALRDAEVETDINEESDNNNNNNKKWVPPKQFQRVTRKFWLKPADVTRFKVEVMKNFPILVFGDRVRLTDLVDTADSKGTITIPLDQPHLLPRLADQHITDTCQVASVYCDDTEELTSYHTRLRREDHSSLVRVRWYGERDASDPNQQLFIERKIHRDATSGVFSTKERCAIAQKDIIPFFQGQPVHSIDQQQDVFMRQTQQFVVEGHQQPIIRTCYTRTAFQMSSNNQVRISLDVDLHMIKEAHSGGGNVGAIPKLPGDWCRDLSVGIPPKDVVHFPYAVVEIKLQAKPPQWLKSLVKSGILLPLPKFSKFLHGTAMLHQHLTDNTPHWFLPAADDDDEDAGSGKKKGLFSLSSSSKTPHTNLLMTPATWEEMSDTFDRYVEDAAEWLFPSMPAAAGETSQIPQLSPGGKQLQHNHKDDEADDKEGSKEVRAGGWMFRNVRRNKTSPTNQHMMYETSGSEEDHTQVSNTDNNVPSLSPTNGTAATFAITAAATLPPASSSSIADASARRTTTWPVYQDPAITTTTTTTTNSSFSTPPRDQAPQQQQPASYVLPLHKDTPSPSSSSSHASLTGGASTPKDSAEDMEEGHGLKTRHSSADNNNTPLGSDKNNSHVATTPFSSSSSTLPQRGSFAMAQYQSLSANGSSGNIMGNKGGNDDYMKTNNSNGESDVALVRRSKSMVRTRVEPKTFFANERTFLQWLQISVLVMLTAMSLLSGSSLTSSVTGNTTTSSSSSGGCSEGDKSCYASKLSGAIIAPVALLFMAYALYMYKKRTIQILRKETVRYDDQRGPVVLVVILIAVFICSYVISIVYAF